MRARLAALVLLLVVSACSGPGGSPGGGRSALPSFQLPAGGPAGTVITLDGRQSGPVFNGVGAISGGGGNSRLLIDYPEPQRARILDYLFGPGGAALQLLKLEIGGDANSSDGAEPSAEHARGQIDCRSGYEWWLAEQAVARDPHLELYGLQWAAPGWAGAGGSIWNQADIGYVIDWLNCARSHGLRISYLGGWNETGYSGAWFAGLRKALDASGYTSVRLLAADAHPPGPGYQPVAAWRVANSVAADPSLRAAVSGIAVHDTCGLVTNGYHCLSTAAARALGLPLWEGELGAMDANSGAASMARSINNGYLQAGVTGFLEWPLIDSMPPGLPFENRGLITADQPWSGYYRVNLMTWAIAQTTRFTRPGWRYLGGAAAPLAGTGSYVGYAGPGRTAWSLVAENTGQRPGQRVASRIVTVKITGGLPHDIVHAWATDLWSGQSSRWFFRLSDIRPASGGFRYKIPAGYVITFTTVPGSSRTSWPGPASAPMPLPWHAVPDASNEPRDLAPQEGAFTYAPCRGGVTGLCVQQQAPMVPLFWRRPMLGTPQPYAVVGDAGWADYTVTGRALIGGRSGSAGLIGRFGQQAGGGNANLFDGYEFTIGGSGAWRLLRHSGAAGETTLASGRLPGFAARSWHSLSLGLHGKLITAAVDSAKVATVRDPAYRSGIAGFSSSWSPVQFTQLAVER